jgi:hypothetical protein
MKTIVDALGRIQKTLNAPKLKSAIARMDATLARADADFSEDDHPRGPDGKFAAKGGISGAAKHGVEAYKKTLKAGAAMKPQGLIKSMIKSGQYSEKDIWEAAKDTFGLSDDKKKWVKHSYYDLKHKSGDKNFPPIPKESTVGMEPEPAAAPEPAPVPAPAPPPPPPPPPPPAPPPVPPPAPVLPSVKNELTSLQSAWANVLPENKPILEGKEKELLDALDHTKFSTTDEMLEAIKALEPIPFPVGMGQTSMNNFIEKVKNKYGVSVPASPATSTLPAGASKKLQAETYAKAKKAGHHSFETVSKFEDASGNKVKSRLVVDTENIPYDGFAKVTAAYGNDTDAMTQAVDSAMDIYADEVRKSLTLEEKSAISDYQGNFYKPVNKQLLGQLSPSSNVTKVINEIKGAIAKNFVPAETPAWRGLTCSMEELTGTNNVQEMVGRVFEHKNFCSVSRSIQTAKFFGEKTMLRFTVPAGVNGIVMTGQNGGEREIVLDSRSMFRVDRVEQTVTTYGEAQHIAHVTYLGTREP